MFRSKSKRSIVSHDYHDYSGVPDNDEAIARALGLTFNGSSTTSTRALSGSSLGGIPLAVNCAKPRTPSAVSISTGSTVSQSSSESTVCSSAGVSLSDSSWVQSAFPEKLHHMLMLNKDPDIISFARHGRCFILHQPKVFGSEVMPRYFKHTKLTSFQRQLNLYGFKRITYGPDSGAYYHELFLRGRPRLGAWMKRQKNKGLGHKPLPDPENEPDFYAMDDIDNLRSRKTEEKKSAKKKPKMKRINMYNPFLKKDSLKKTNSDGSVHCDGSFNFSSQFRARFKPATYPLNQPQQAQTFFSGMAVRIPYAPQMPPQHVYDLPPQQIMSFPVSSQKLPPPAVPDQIYVGPNAMPLAHLHPHHQQQLHQYRAPQHVSQNFFPQCAHLYGGPQPQHHQTNSPYNIEMCGVPNFHNAVSQVCPQCKSCQLPTSSNIPMSANLPMPANLPAPANLSAPANLPTPINMCNNQQSNSTGPSHNFNFVPQVPATDKNISPTLVTYTVPEIQRVSPESVKDHANENRLSENPSDLSFLPDSKKSETEVEHSQLESVESSAESNFLTSEVLGDEETMCRPGQRIKNSSVVPGSVCPREKSDMSMSNARLETENSDDDSTNECVEDDSKTDEISIGMRSVSLASTVSLNSEGDERKNKQRRSWLAMCPRLGNKSSDQNFSDRSVSSSESITSHWLWDPTGHVASGVEDDIYFD
eukprot:CAMPEP_0194306848 /NCGR_PEP_ID=MMETSP0171-20130528/3833_1 /TAXON_ID=218684 /ORGANISM="Corethron pennatum, Strain L29A3" /LENGTH=700 /DNA_ID=CAMNT_0039058703 /DNA_START=30 /DNA_END=2129 /DNA_ORIENTATION=-